MKSSGDLLSERLGLEKRSTSSAAKVGGRRALPVGHRHAGCAGEEDAQQG